MMVNNGSCNVHNLISWLMIAALNETLEATHESLIPLEEDENEEEERERDRAVEAEVQDAINIARELGREDALVAAAISSDTDRMEIDVSGGLSMMKTRIFLFQKFPDGNVRESVLSGVESRKNTCKECLYIVHIMVDVDHLEILFMS